MSNLMNDPNQPPDEEPSRLMRVEDTQATVVQVSFLPKAPDLPEIHHYRRGFATRVLASEFLREAAKPLHEAQGSPIQARLKKAALLRIAPEILDNYEIEVKFVEPANDGPANRDASGVRTPDPEPLLGGSSGIDDGGLDTFESTLSESEDDPSEDGGEAEDGGEEPDET